MSPASIHLSVRLSVRTSGRPVQLYPSSFAARQQSFEWATVRTVGRAGGRRADVRASGQAAGRAEANPTWMKHHSTSDDETCYVRRPIRAHGGVQGGRSDPLSHRSYILDGRRHNSTFRRSIHLRQTSCQEAAAAAAEAAAMAAAHNGIRPNHSRRVSKWTLFRSARTEEGFRCRAANQTISIRFLRLMSTASSTNVQRFFRQVAYILLLYGNRRRLSIFRPEVRIFLTRARA